MAFLMAEVKKETDAWRLHQSFRDFRRLQQQQQQVEGEEEKREEEGSPEPQVRSGFQMAMAKFLDWRCR